MFSDRAIAICLLDILIEYTDEKNILAMKDIRHKMELQYSLKPDRRTIYSAISLLIDMGYDISVYEENKVGYYIRSRDFEPSEILLLSDAIYTFPFVSNKQSEEMIKRLQKQLSVHNRKKQRHLTVVRSSKKTDNKQVFWNIEQLEQAISEERQVSFTYFKYGFDKKLVPRREKPYVVNPHRMLYINEHYYLVCSYEEIDHTSMYRIDKMKDIKILEKKWSMPAAKQSESRDSLYAFSGKTERVTMHCDNIILDDVIDKFGTEVWIKKLDEEKFLLSVDAPPHGMKFWALQYLPYIEVVEPKWLRNEIIECVRENKYRI